MKENILYRETQGMYWFPALMMGIAIAIVFAYVYQWGTKPVPLEIAILIFVLFTILSLPFYKLTITVTQTYVLASFGVGWIKKKVLIKDLDLTTAQIVNIPWYAGIGYRWGKQGTFLNTRPGPALLIKTHNKYDEFFVGTKKGKEIIDILSKLQGSVTGE